MASLNLAGKTSGYVKVTAPDDSSTNPTVVLPKESGELALKSDITGGGGGSGGGAPSVDTAIGMVAPFAMDSVPTGWLHCDGSAVSRDTYSLLYSKVGDTYGNGDGSTTFNLPDLQDEFIRGSSDTLPVGNKQDDEFKSHLHEFKVSKNPTYAETGAVGAEGGKMSGRSVGGAVTNGDPNYGMDKTGGSETRPRNVAMLYCINATAEPSSGGGETTDILPVLHAGVVDSGGNLVEGSGYTPSRLGEGYYQIDFNTPLSNNKYTVNVTPASTASNFHATFSDTSTSGFKIKVGNQSGGVSLDKDMSFGFTVTGTETIAVGGGSGGDSIWTEKDGVATYDGDVIINGGTNVKGDMYWGKSGKGRLFADYNWGCIFRADTSSPNQADFMWQNADDVERMRIGSDGTVHIPQDMTVNGLTVGKGSGNVNTNNVFGVDVLVKNTTGAANTVLGRSSFNKNETGNNNVVVGNYAVQNAVSNGGIVAVGNSSLQNSTGERNTALGIDAGKNLTSGGNNTCIGANAQPSSATVSNEVTLGDANVSVVRMGNGRPLTTTVDVDTAIDKKLAIKDKLIEKLSERLDSLEKKLKKAK